MVEVIEPTFEEVFLYELEANGYDAKNLIDKIIEKAKESNVPIHEDSKLAGTLSKLEIGDMIPPELYEAVAEVLVFVDAMEKIRKKGL